MSKHFYGSCSLLIWMFVCCSGVGPAIGGQPGAVATRSYCLRVLSDYEVCWLGPGGANDKGRFALMRRTKSFCQESVVDPIQSYGVWGHFVVGATPSGFFILDTNPVDNGTPRPSIARNRDDWEASLRKYGIPREILLLNPDEVAASRPARELYPEDYVFMKGLLGLSDGQWSLAIQVVAVTTCLVLGMSGVGLATGIFASIGIALAANIGGQMFMAGGGPGFFVGMIGSPVLCCCGWGLGRIIRRICYRRVPQGHA